MVTVVRISSGAETLSLSLTFLPVSRSYTSKMIQSNPEFQQRSVVSSFVSDAGETKLALFRRSEKVNTYQYVSKAVLLSTVRVQIY
jgi:hypothetical protein